MQKYKITFGSKQMKEEEIDQYKNFDALLTQKASYLHKKKVNKWMYGSIGTIIGVTALSLAFWPLEKQQVVPAQNKMETLKTQPKSIENVEKASTTQPKSRLSTTETAKKPTSASAIISKTKVPDPSTTTSSSAFIEATPSCGYEKLYEYLRENCQYPDSLSTSKINGVVLVQFTINKQGKAEKISVVKRLHPALDQEAIRVVARMPLWTPASIEGKPLETRLILPLTFQTK